jgi:hypothetical protein
MHRLMFGDSIETGTKRTRWKIPAGWETDGKSKMVAATQQGQDGKSLAAAAESRCLRALSSQRNVQFCSVKMNLASRAVIGLLRCRATRPQLSLLQVLKDTSRGREHLLKSPTNSAHAAFSPSAFAWRIQVADVSRRVRLLQLRCHVCTETRTAGQPASGRPRLRFPGSFLLCGATADDGLVKIRFILEAKPGPSHVATKACVFRPARPTERLWLLAVKINHDGGGRIESIQRTQADAHGRRPK